MQIINQKKALIFGITGQDGSYLCRFLLEKGYQVHGVKRRSSSLNTYRIDDIYEDFHDSKNFFLHYGDLSDGQSIFQLVNNIKPNEIYNLAAQSHVAVSFELPEYTMMVNAIGTLKILESIKNINSKIRYYQAGTSEMFGSSPPPQNEKTIFHPRSPYAIAKLSAHWLTVNYRESYNLYACNGILFNHESPVRGETFVTRKITRALARIKLGLQDILYIGNLNAKRDWGHAKDFVEAQWKIMQLDDPDDFVIATGEQYSVRNFIDCAAKYLGMNINWRGTGIGETGSLNGREIIKVDSRYYRPSEVESLLGDFSKAKEILDWTPKIKFHQLIKEMIEEDLILAKKDEIINEHNYKIKSINDV